MWGGSQLSDASMSDVPVDSGSTASTTSERFRFSLRGIFKAMFACGLVFFVMFRVLPAGKEAEEAARRASCKNNFKQLAIAVRHYHDLHEVFPTAFVTDAGGRPMHSWRAPMLPYIDAKNVWAKYDFNSPWDSPSNLLCRSTWVPTLLCPSESTLHPGYCTPYVMIVGDEAAMQPGKWTCLADLDDPANTILVAEIADSDIFWAEPRDLQFDTMSFRVNDPAGNCISSHHRGGAHVLMADGSVRFLANYTDPAVVRALCTRDATDNPKP